MRTCEEVTGKVRARVDRLRRRLAEELERGNADDNAVLARGIADKGQRRYHPGVLSNWIGPHTIRIVTKAGAQDTRCP